MRDEELLPDELNQGEFTGVTIRKGSVGAFLANARTLADSAASPAERAVAEQDIADALPALRTLGLFDLLEIRDEALRRFVETH